MSESSRRAGAAREAQRRRRLEEVFGPTSEQTRDDLDLEADGGPSARGSRGRGDAWLREQVPPHHGG